jgi:hypothetical protein
MKSVKPAPNFILWELNCHSGILPIARINALQFVSQIPEISGGLHKNKAVALMT